MTSCICSLSDCRSSDAAHVGAKAANQGELLSLGLGVPGICLTVDAFAGVVAEAAAIPSSNVSMRERLLQCRLPASLSRELELALVQGGLTGLCMVRSSATGEDGRSASFAGLHDSLVSKPDIDSISRAAVQVWASLFNPRALAYRDHLGLDVSRSAMAVLIQPLIEPIASGTLFTGFGEHLLIEGVWGLGEALVGGSATPAQYLLSHASLEVMEARPGLQPLKARPLASGEIEHVPLSAAEAATLPLREEQARWLGALGLLLEDHFERAQDVEWVLATDRVLHIVQSRPMTTALDCGSSATGGDDSHLQVLRGIPASPGVCSGPVAVYKRLPAAGSLVADRVMVTHSTNPEWLPVLLQSRGVVTDLGGATCHAAVVSRELGLPAVVGTGVATQTLMSDEHVFVDGSAGVVYRGDGRPVEADSQSAPSRDTDPLLAAMTSCGLSLWVAASSPEGIADLGACSAVRGVVWESSYLAVAMAGWPPSALRPSPRAALVERLVRDAARLLSSGLPVLIELVDSRSAAGGAPAPGLLRDPRGLQILLLQLEILRAVQQPVDVLLAGCADQRDIQVLIEACSQRGVAPRSCSVRVETPMQLLAAHSFDCRSLWLDWGKLAGHMFGGPGRVRVDDGRHKALVEAVGRLMTGSRLTIPVVLTNWPARLGEGALKELVRAVPGVTALCLPFAEALSLDKDTHHRGT